MVILLVVITVQLEPKSLRGITLPAGRYRIRNTYYIYLPSPPLSAPGNGMAGSGLGLFYQRSAIAVAISIAHRACSL
jgi:hypothetical protein